MYSKPSLKKVITLNWILSRFHKCIIRHKYNVKHCRDIKALVCGINYHHDKFEVMLVALVKFVSKYV